MRNIPITAPAWAAQNWAETAAWKYLATLAAAYAEDAQFDKAVEWQTTAIELATINTPPNIKSFGVRHGCFAFGLIAVRFPVRPSNEFPLTLGQHAAAILSNVCRSASQWSVPTMIEGSAPTASPLALPSQIAALSRHRFVV